MMLLMILPVFAGEKEKDEDTLRQANLVLQGLLGVFRNCKYECSLPMIIRVF
jgi:hypothetical protein